MNEITVFGLKELIESDEKFTLLDVRDYHELHISKLQIETVHIPFDDLQSRTEELSMSNKIIVLCRSGNSAASACELLQKNGFENVYTLKGGINEWAQKIDPTLPVY